MTEPESRTLISDPTQPEKQQLRALLRSLSPASVHKVLIYARTLHQIEEERKETSQI